MPLKRIERPDLGLVWYEFDRPGLRNGLLTRLGGTSQGPFAGLNLGSTVGDSLAAVASNHARVFAAFGLRRSDVVSPHQVHGRRVAAVSADDGGTVIAETDALITAQPGLALLLRFADCTPVLLYDPVRHVAGLAHAGWRGVVAGVVPETVHALTTQFGTAPADLWAGIGPTIGHDHYAVGADVVDAVRATLPPHSSVASRVGEEWHLDLPEAVSAQLRMVGVTTIERSGFCTACRTEEWYSHRAEGGNTGRFGVVAVLG